MTIVLSLVLGYLLYFTVAGYLLEGRTLGCGVMFTDSRHGVMTSYKCRQGPSGLDDSFLCEDCRGSATEAWFWPVFMLWTAFFFVCGLPFKLGRWVKRTTSEERGFSWDGRSTLSSEPSEIVAPPPAPFKPPTPPPPEMEATLKSSDL
jgi:hypothetical protein